jgi:hypothetical protein
VSGAEVDYAIQPSEYLPRDSGSGGSVQ